MKRLNNKLVVVLGIHCGDTGSIERGLQVIGGGEGSLEDADLKSFNVEILNLLNTDWHFLAPIQSAAIDELFKNGCLERAIDLLRKKTTNVHFFGFKDPSVAKLLPFWKEAFVQSQMDVNYLITLRHPLDMSEALAKHGFDVKKSHLMWLEYVLACLTGTTGEKRILVDYERLIRSPENELNRVAEKWDLEVTDPQMGIFKSEFLEEALRPTFFFPEDGQQDPSIPPLVNEVYKEVMKAAVDTVYLEGAAFQSHFARWSEEFFRQRPALILIDSLTVQLAAINMQLNEKEQVLQEKERWIQALTSKIVEKEQALQALAMQASMLQSQLHEILSSKVWKVALLFRQIRLWVAPLNSTRTRLWDFITSPQRYREIRKDISLINSSDLFDRKWYLSKYPVVKGDPARHYLQVGGFEGLNPSPHFNSSWYLSTYPDVKKAGINPLLHYLKYGRIEGYDPKPQSPSPDIMVSLQNLFKRLDIPGPVDEIVSVFSERGGYIKTITSLVEVETFLSRGKNREKYSLVQASQLPEPPPTSDKKNILFITSLFPDSHHGGGNRVLNFIEELSKSNDIYLCTAFSQPEHEIHLPAVEKYCKSILKIPFERFGGNQAEIREWLHGIPMDIVHYEWIYSLRNYASDMGQFQIFTYMEAVSLRLLMDMGRLQTLSEEWLDKFQQLSDALLFELVLAAPMNARVAVTTKDAEFFQKLFPFQEYAVLNHGLDFESFALPDVEPESQTLVFVGNYQHYPNVDAMRFFFDTMWENIRSKLPGIRIYVVGVVPPDELLQLSDGKSIIVTGAVPDVRVYIQKASVCIAPLVTGAGLRGKVIEYAALRRTFVATSIATTDLLLKDGVDYFCADKPEEFSQKIINLLEKPGLARQMADSAYNTARKYYDTKQLTSYLISLYQYLEIQTNAN